MRATALNVQLTAAEGDLGIWPIISESKLTSPKQPVLPFPLGLHLVSAAPLRPDAHLLAGQLLAGWSCSLAWPYLDDPQGFAGVVFVQVG